MLDENGLVKTIDESMEVPNLDDSHSEESEVEEESNDLGRKRKRKIVEKNSFNKHFRFEDSFTSTDIAWHHIQAPGAKHGPALLTSLDNKISKIRYGLKAEAISNANKEFIDSLDVQASQYSEESSSESENEKKICDMQKDNLRDKKHRGKKKKANLINPTQVQVDTEFGDDKIHYSKVVTSFDETLSFQDLNLSRPLLRALTEMKFDSPTPIQAATIPMALLGKDICACAVTGSGKTAAFLLPILERLLFKPKQAPVTRVLILEPTRELAVQVYQVGEKLCTHCSITVGLSTGGLDLQAQENMLRRGPDIVVATPGRLIDHLHNSPSFSIQNIEILVLDEADRMLDEYFAEQLKEIVRLCSKTRQTMLFSATMTEYVKDVASVSLKDPVKIFVNRNTQMALNLRQEFIRIRPNREDDREAILVGLILRTFTDRSIVFLQTKKQAHRMHIVFGLLGVKVGELHSDISQTERLDMLTKFRDGAVNVLFATDLAARGLDIQNVKTIINFTMPNSLKHYIHRVGRTARAGKSGRSVSLVGEEERRLLKEILKVSVTTVKNRVIPQEVVLKCRDRITDLEAQVLAVLKLEKEEKCLRAAENKIHRVQNILSNNPHQRTWFQTKKERDEEKMALVLEQPTSRMKKTKKGEKDQKIKTKSPRTANDRVKKEIVKAQAFYVKSTKKQFRNVRMRSHNTDTPKSVNNDKKKKKKKPKK